MPRHFLSSLITGKTDPGSQDAAFVKRNTEAHGVQAWLETNCS